MVFIAIIDNQIPADIMILAYEEERIANSYRSWGFFQK